MMLRHHCVFAQACTLQFYSQARSLSADRTEFLDWLVGQRATTACNILSQSLAQRSIQVFTDYHSCHLTNRRFGQRHVASVL